MGSQHREAINSAPEQRLNCIFLRDSDAFALQRLDRATNMRRHTWVNHKVLLAGD